MDLRYSLVLDERLAPPVGSPQRPAYERWLLFAMAELRPPVLEAMLVRAKGDALAFSRARTAFESQLRVVEQALAAGPYLLGAGPTAADLLVARVLAWARSMALLEAQSALAEYARRVAAAVH